MSKLNWCIRQRAGITLVEPNPNLADAYLKKAEDSLVSITINKIRDWKISTAYYTIYFSLYAILMKLGVKCEIHSCTIEFAKHFLKDYFKEDEFDLLEDSLKARIDSQYYVDKRIKDEQFQEMIKTAPKFFVKCKLIIEKINENKVNSIRKELKQILK